MPGDLQARRVFSLRGRPVLVQPGGRYPHRWGPTAPQLWEKQEKKIGGYSWEEAKWRGSHVPKVDDGSCDDPTPARGVVGQLSLLNPLLDSSDMVLRPGSALGLSCPALMPRTLFITAWARPPMEPSGEGTSRGEARTIVDPALPAAGSLAPVGLTSPPREEEREIIPKRAACNRGFNDKTPGRAVLSRNKAGTHFEPLQTGIARRNSSKINPYQQQHHYGQTSPWENAVGETVPRVNHYQLQAHVGQATSVEGHVSNTDVSAVMPLNYRKPTDGRTQAHNDPQHPSCTHDATVSAPVFKGFLYEGRPQDMPMRTLSPRQSRAPVLGSRAAHQLGVLAHANIEGCDDSEDGVITHWRAGLLCIPHLPGLGHLYITRAISVARLQLKKRVQGVEVALGQEAGHHLHQQHCLLKFELSQQASVRMTAHVRVTESCKACHLGLTGNLVLDGGPGRLTQNDLAAVDDLAEAASKPLPFTLQGKSDGQDSLIVISLMDGHGDPRASKQQTPIRSVLYGSTHVQRLGGPSVVQHIGLCRMAEPDCIHCLGKEHFVESHLVDPEGCRPGFQLIHAQLFNLGEAGIAHTVPQIEPGILSQSPYPHQEEIDIRKTFGKPFGRPQENPGKVESCSHHSHDRDTAGCSPGRNSPDEVRQGC
ncbi:MAG: hypothetical protein FRX49_01385 [Trebouxia sp. A1-2]|nr:MAG: hypothetical protein FRX49_01385 [Trebouxia sp. A1-2]